MLALCLDLRGFYLKAGQFLGTRPDFMPLPYIVKLSTLHDRVPPMSEAQIRKVRVGWFVCLFVFQSQS